MEDIAPKILQQLDEDFQKKFKENKKIQSLCGKIKEGKATYKEVYGFAIETGETLSSVFQENLSSSMLPDGKLYYNIADRTIRQMLQNNYELVAEASREVQETLNRLDGIGIKAIKPEMNEDKVNGIIDIVSGKDKYDEVAYMLGEPIVNFTLAVVDAAVRENADFQYKAGLSPKIRRTSTGKCCKWCDRLTGIYDYGEVSDTGNDVFRRHKRCRCLVEYEPGGGKKQNVHTKQWSKQNESDKIKAREKEERIKQENDLGLAEKIASHPKMLQAYTPERLKEVLENAGYDVKPLNRGSLKGKLFEEGGGFKVNFGGDGIFQYHPKEKSHHGGEYYKINTGSTGKKWYTMKGDEIDVEETRRLGKQVKKKIQNTDDK